MSIDGLLKTLKSKGMKITPQRIEILRTLMELKDRHPSLNELYERVRERIPTLSFSTLYSTIRRLEELGFIKLFDLLGETRIEVNMRPHINIIELDEGVVRDLNDDELVEVIVEKLALKDKGDVLVNVLVYTGRRVRPFS